VGTDLLVIADFDVLKQQLENPRLVDGSPIPITELHKLALEANLLPSIFDTKTQDMWLGRRVRTATEAQRIALIARDQCCIGCGANPLWCQAHHIIWWSKNGPTNLENLVLVCNDCHHKIHDDGWQVHKHPKTGKYYLKPPTQPKDNRPTVSSDKPARNSLGDPTTQPSGQRPTISPDEPSTNPSGKHPTVPPDKPSTNPSGEPPAVSVAEVPTISSGERPTVPSDVPSTRPTGKHPAAPPDKSASTLPDEPSTNPSGKHPTVPPNKPSTNPSGESATNLSGKPPNRLSDKSARTSSLGSSTSGPGDSLHVSVGGPSTQPADKRPTLSVGEPLSGPANKRPTVLSEKSARTSSGKPPNRQSGERPTVLSDKSAGTSSLGLSSSGPGDSLHVSVGGPSTQPADKRPTLSVGEPLSGPADEFPNIASNDPPIHPADQRPTISSSRPDRAQTRVDSAQPVAGDSPRSTIQNAPGLAHVEQTLRKKQTNPDAEQQHPTTRSTRHDPVDGIDTS
ncbi:MAG: HNH endonuclease, partial [Acidimicrobiia bacterium]|nr:HNH endonuclease [Acidimicrobiia bacterium]